MDGDFSDDSLQKWRKMVAIYERFMRTNEFEAKEWANCLQAMGQWKAPYLQRAQTAIRAGQFPIEPGPFDSWIPYIIASIVDIVIPNRDVEASAQSKQWISRFSCTINDRLRIIKEFKSEDYHRRRELQRKQDRSRYAKRIQVSNELWHSGRVSRHMCHSIVSDMTLGT